MIIKRDEIISRMHAFAYCCEIYMLLGHLSDMLTYISGHVCTNIIDVVRNYVSHFITQVFAIIDLNNFGPQT